MANEVDEKWRERVLIRPAAVLEDRTEGRASAERDSMGKSPVEGSWSESRGRGGVACD